MINWRVANTDCCDQKRSAAANERDIKMMRYLSASVVILSAALSLTAASAQTFIICEGELQQHESWCGQHDVFVNCTELKTQAAVKCRAMGASGTPNIVKLHSHDGDQCGYDTHKVTCQ